jgi:GNAT superfamily N-acetyltransferase
MLYLELIVHPRHRRRGVATGLLERVHAVARRHDRPDRRPHQTAFEADDDTHARSGSPSSSRRTVVGVSA